MAVAGGRVLGWAGHCGEASSPATGLLGPSTCCPAQSPRVRCTVGSAQRPAGSCLPDQDVNLTKTVLCLEQK